MGFARVAAKSREAALCHASADVLLVTGAGITIMAGGQAGPICKSSNQIAALEDLQFELGDGPCQDAYRLERPVHVPFMDSAASARWPVFVNLALASNIGGVFAYPLISKRSKVGVLTLYQTEGGELTSSQHDDSLCVAEVLTETVLNLQSDAPPDTLAEELEDIVAYRAEFYQASGMAAIQLQVPPEEALVRMRAYAFANSQSIEEVAAAIVNRKLRLTDDRQRPEGGKP